LLRNFLFFTVFWAAFLGLMLPGSVFSIDTRSIYYLWESGHFFLFFLGWHLLYILYPRLLSFDFFRQLVFLLGVTLVGVGAVEGMQGFISGKSLSLGDILGDVAGALFYLSFRYRREWARYFLLHGMALFLAGIVFWPFFCSLFDEILARHQFPLLADFETPFEKSRFEGSTGSGARSDEQAFHGRHSLRLSLFPGPWSGMTLKYFSPDWQGYTFLQFSLYNPSSHPVSLEVWIRDAAHEQEGKPYNDLFSRIIDLPAGCWTEVRISLDGVRQGPQGREMELGQITGLGFFVEKEKNPLTLYLDMIRLE
jgi:hypothetical protein